LRDSNKSNKKRLLAAGIVTAILLGGAGAAYAYWTNTGSGVGEAETGTNAAVTIVQTSVVSGMAPGVAPQSLNGTINNPNDGPAYVDEISVSISAVEDALGDPIVGCSAADYVIAGSPIDFSGEALANDTTTWTGATIAFDNDPLVNQDACKNAIVVLEYSSN
jgi:hypothetical protein